MDSKNTMMRRNVKLDRLSSLPDDLIRKILSFIDIEDAIGMSALSSRWRFIWASMPYLNFSGVSFRYSYYTDSHEFVKNVMSRRNNQIQVFSLKFSCGLYNNVLSREILESAFSSYVQHATCSEFLKHLTVSGCKYGQHLRMPALATWELPALTTLHLDYVTFYVDDDDDDDTDKGTVGLFSKCANLQNLILIDCSVNGLDGFHICHPRLSNLTLENINVRKVNVVAPQLMNLTLNHCRRELFVSAPKLASLLLTDLYLVPLSTDGFPCLERLNLCFIRQRDASDTFRLLQQLNTIKFLTINTELIELLYSSMELLSNQPSPFANLKGLRIYPENVSNDMQDIMCTGIINYLLDSSPSAALTMTSREDVRAMRNTTRVKDLMAELRVLLKKEKAVIKTNKAKRDQGKAQVENQREMQFNIQGRTKKIRSCWKDLSVPIKRGEKKMSGIIWVLHNIEELMTKLPASYRAKIQASYTSVRAEATTILSEIMDCIKIQFDEQQSQLNVFCQEFVTTSEQVSLHV